MDEEFKGFRESASGSGLIVPDQMSREEQLWTEDERLAVHRAAAVLSQRGVKLGFFCADRRCQADPVIEFIETLEGGITLRCGHADRRLRPPQRIERAQSRRERRRAKLLAQKRQGGIKPRIEHG